MSPDPNDRLSLALCIAAIFHGFVLLGVGFNAEPKLAPRQNPEPLDVVLVQQRSLKPPPEANLLAQANLQGGGGLEEPEVTPESAAPAAFPAEQPELTAAKIPPEATPPTPEPPQPEAVAMEQEAQADKELLSRTGAPEIRDPRPKPPEPQPEGTRSESSPAASRRPDASRLVTESLKIATLTAQLQRRIRKEASRPRRKFISASTKEYKYAAYMETWRAKVERVGNFNYPQEARRRRLTGNLILDVALNADGTLNDVTLRRSSGHAVLDEAALHIVRLAAPYSPFPREFRREVDILHITRTWQFLENQGFR